MAQYSAVLLLSAALVALAQRYVARRGADTDFFPRWYALRALLFENRDPYDGALSAEIVGQTSLAAAPETVRAAYGFVYPLPGALLLAPLTLLPYEWAAAIWLAAGLVGLAAAGVLMAAVGSGGLEPALARGDAPALRRGLAGALVVLVSVPALWNLALVQPGLAIPPLVALAIHQRSLRPALAGASLALAALLKPQLVLLLTALWLGASVARSFGRDGEVRALGRRFVLGAVVVGAALLVAATVLAPGWAVDALAAASTYARAAPMATTSPAMFALASAVLPDPLARGLALLAGAALIAWAVHGWRRDDLTGAMRSIVAGALVTPPAWETTAIVLTLPLAFAAGAARHPWRLVGLAVATGAALAPVSLVWPWRVSALVVAAYAALVVVAAPRSGRSAAGADAAAPPDRAAPEPR